MAGTAAPIRLNFLDAWGAVTGSVFPTGRRIDVIDGIEVTCIDAAMPLMIVRAGDLGVDAARDTRTARRPSSPARSAGVAAPHRRPADGAGRRHRFGHPQAGAGQRRGRRAERHLARTSRPTAAMPRTPRPARSAWPPRSPCPTPWRAHLACWPGATTSRCCTRRAASTYRSRWPVTVTTPRSPGRRWCAPPARSCRATCTSPTTCSPRPEPAHPTAPAQPIPGPPLAIIVPTSAGGANDAIARAVARGLGPHLGRPVTVDNRSGAHGSIACEYVARARADGHTLLLGYIATHAMNPALQPLGYHPVTDFAPVGLIGHSPPVLVTAAGAPVRSVPELISRGHADPSGCRYASAGDGTAPHFAAELFAAQRRHRDARADPRRFRTRAARHRRRTRRRHVRQPVQRAALDHQRSAAGAGRRRAGPGGRAPGRAHPARGRGATVSTSRSGTRCSPRPRRRHRSSTG